MSNHFNYKEFTIFCRLDPKITLVYFLFILNDLLSLDEKVQTYVLHISSAFTINID